MSLSWHRFVVVLTAVLVLPSPLGAQSGQRAHSLSLSVVPQQITPTTEEVQALLQKFFTEKASTFTSVYGTQVQFLYTREGNTFLGLLVHTQAPAIRERSWIIFKDGRIASSWEHLERVWDSKKIEFKDGVCTITTLSGKERHEKEGVVFVIELNLKARSPYAVTVQYLQGPVNSKEGSTRSLPLTFEVRGVRTSAWLYGLAV